MINVNNRTLLFVVFDIHLNAGGERVVANMANHFIGDGWLVDILSFGRMKSSKVYDLSDKVKIHYLNTSSNKILQKILAMIKTWLFMSKKKYSYVVAIGSYPSSILGFAGNRNSICIGTEHLHYYHAPSIWNFIRRFAYPRLTALTVLTQHDYPILKELNPKTYVIPNALTFLPDVFSSCSQHKFLAVGRLSEVKQFDKLIRIFSEYIKSEQTWMLDIIGEGSLYSSLQKMIIDYRLENYVRIKPYSNQIEKEYLNSSILISTSRSEGLPMVMIEAQSYGLPIIAYNCKTGPSDIIIDGRNGFLIPLDDETMMVERMLELSGNDDLRKIMGENAKEDAQRFSPGCVYGKWDALFEELAH